MQYQSILVHTTEPGLALNAIQHLIEQEEFPLESNNPDIWEVMPSGSTIGIDQIHSLREWSSKRPFQYSFKLAVLHQAEVMTVQAQNSLLKTLEEPQEHTQIVLITHQPHSLLQTIRSRVQIHELANRDPVASSRYTVSGTEYSVEEFLKSSYLARKKIMDDILKHSDRAGLQSFTQELAQHISETARQKSETIKLDQCISIIKALQGGVSTKLVAENLCVL